MMTSWVCMHVEQGVIGLVVLSHCQPVLVESYDVVGGVIDTKELKLLGEV